MGRRGNGEGSIFKRQKNGKTIWVGQYILYKQPNGKNKYKTFYGKTREEVRNKLENLITELRTNAYVDKNNTTFISVANDIVETEYKLNKLSDNSYLRKKGTLEQIKKHYIAEMELQKIQENDVMDFLSYITKYSNSVISKIYGLVNNTFKKAVKKNIIRYNFLDDKEEFFKPKSIKQNKKVRALTLDEQKQLLDVLYNNDVKYKYQMLLSMFTGMRMGEVNALTLDDIDLKNKTISISKTLTRDAQDKTIVGKTTKTYTGNRVLHIENYVVNILKEVINHHFILNPKKLLFYDEKKTYVTTSQVNCVFKRLCEKYNIALGYNVNQHMLRHTYATRMIESGMQANVVQKKLGHAKIETTLEIYTNVFEEYEKKNSEVATKYLEENGLIRQNFGQ